jgi:hypothetical protein
VGLTTSWDDVERLVAHTLTKDGVELTNEEWHELIDIWVDPAFGAES